MERFNARELLQKYANGTCTPQEKFLFEQWYINLNRTDRLELSETELLEVEQEISQRLGLITEGNNNRTLHLWRYISVAATILLCLSIGAYFFLPIRPQQQIIKNNIHDLEPGSNKAILTIGNGQKIVLTGARNGMLAVQGNMVVDKTADGKVVYQSDQNSSGELTNIIYNTMTTPRGGKYDLVLADGTKVWLDAASSVTYPTQFSGNEREIEMTGQAYFEVAHDASKPFRVKVNGQTVEVLGTHFNINAYTDESVIKTTLLEGRVKVSKNMESAMLQPGQESVIVQADDKIKVQDADVEAATAWKNGHFHFKADNIHTVMRQLARWYDVDIEYDGKIPARSFSGDIDRNSKASEVLKILSLSDIDFKIEGKKIIVTP
jgi:transmembrane sensor